MPQLIEAGGANWSVDNTGSTSTGMPYTGGCNIAPPGLAIKDATIDSPVAFDAFDIGYGIYIDGTIFDVGTTVDLTGSTITAGPASLSGLEFSYQMYFSPVVQVARLRAIFSNPSAAPINATIDVPVNFGSDASTVQHLTSSGDAAFTAADRWMVTSDGNPTDVVNTTVLYGPGSPAVVPSAVTTTVFSCSATNGAGATFPISVPAGETRSLVFFAGLGDVTGPGNSAPGAATAALAFDDNYSIYPDLFDGLADVDLEEILNWDFSCHDVCTAGASMAPGCDDPCVAIVCATDTSCCSTAESWDDQCIGEVQTVCGSLQCCGNGEIAGIEECDDGNVTLDGNCCAADCTDAALDTPCNNTDGDHCTTDLCNASGDCSQHIGEPVDPMTCLAAPAAKLQIKDSATAGKDKLSWQWGKGAAFDQIDLGTPTNADSYSLCIFDTTATVPSLEASLNIAPSGTKWINKDPKGFQYKDKAGASDGVTKAQLKTGAMGKTKIKVSARTSNLVLPAPFDAMSFFNQDTSVLVQLINSGGTCWTSSFAAGDTSKNGVDEFKAQVK